METILVFGKGKQNNKISFYTYWHYTLIEDDIDHVIEWLDLIVTDTKCDIKRDLVNDNSWYGNNYCHGNILEFVENFFDKDLYEAIIQDPFPTFMTKKGPALLRMQGTDSVVSVRRGKTRSRRHKKRQQTLKYSYKIYLLHKKKMIF